LRSEADWRFKTLKACVRIEGLGDGGGVRGALPPADVCVLRALAAVIILVIGLIIISGELLGPGFVQSIRW